MLSFDDNRWAGLEAGYRRPIDLRPLLKNLEVGDDPQAAWNMLWQELHHQGDIGLGSFVAVPHLVRIHRAREKVDWNTYALIATIELARGRGRNPEVPEWAADAYNTALLELGQIGLAELPRAADPETVRSILAVLAVVRGARTYGRVLVELTEDEVAELLGEQ